MRCGIPVPETTNFERAQGIGARRQLVKWSDRFFDAALRQSRPGCAAGAAATGSTNAGTSLLMRSAFMRACSQFGNHIAICGKTSTSTTQITWITMKSAMPR